MSPLIYPNPQKLSHKNADFWFFFSLRNFGGGVKEKKKFFQALAFSPCNSEKQKKYEGALDRVVNYPPADETSVLMDALKAAPAPHILTTKRFLRRQM